MNSNQKKIYEHLKKLLRADKKMIVDFWTWGKYIVSEIGWRARGTPSDLMARCELTVEMIQKAHEEVGVERELSSWRTNFALAYRFFCAAPTDIERDEVLKVLSHRMLQRILANGSWPVSIYKRRVKTAMRLARKGKRGDNLYAALGALVEADKAQAEGDCPIRVAIERTNNCINELVLLIPSTVSVVTSDRDNMKLWYSGVKGRNLRKKKIQQLRKFRRKIDECMRLLEYHE